MMATGERSTIEAWLAAVLMERRPAWPLAPEAGVEAVLKAANAEGVAALLQARLQATSLVVPAPLRAGLDAMVRVKAAQNLYREAQCRAILARLAEAALPVLLLKGSALAYWAYPAAHLRECSDIDLLLPDAEAARQAVAAIAPLGYLPADAAPPGDMVNFETTCVGGMHGSRLEIDVHWHLSNAPLFAFRFGWDELWADAVPLPALAPNARGLAPVPALLHACMHRVQHVALGGRDRLKWLYDTVVLARGFDKRDWQEVMRQAADRSLAGTCSATLQAASTRFGIFVPEAVRHTLAAAARRESMRVDRLAHWWYFQWMNWRALPRAGMRWRWLHQRLVPDAAYLRARHGSRGGVPAALWRRLLAGARRLRG